MSNLAKAVQRLQKERDQARTRVEQLDEALKALGSLGGLRGRVGRVAGVLRRPARSGEPCQRRRASELQPLSVRVGRNGKQPGETNKGIQRRSV